MDGPITQTERHSERVIQPHTPHPPPALLVVASHGNGHRPRLYCEVVVKLKLCVGLEELVGLEERKEERKERKERKEERKERGTTPVLACRTTQITAHSTQHTAYIIHYTLYCTYLEDKGEAVVVDEKIRLLRSVPSKA